MMNRKESRLLGQILRNADVNLTFYGIDIEQLAEGERDISFEEMQYVLRENPTTHVRMLSLNLKEELTSSKS